MLRTLSFEVGEEALYRKEQKRQHQALLPTIVFFLISPFLEHFFGYFSTAG